MFGNESKPARIWSFKAKGILEGEQIVSDQIHLVHEYKNNLVQIERERRDAVEVCLHKRDLRLTKIKAKATGAVAAIVQLEDAIKLRSQRDRKRSKPTADERRRIKELKAESKEAYTALITRREALFANAKVQADLAVIDRVAAKAAKDAKEEVKAKGLFWGSYNFAKQSLGNIRSGAPPKRRRWHPSGAIVIQLQAKKRGGSTRSLTWSDALLCRNNFLRIELVAAESRQSHSVGGKYLPVPDPDSIRSGHYRMAIVWFRVGSNDDPRKTPIWAKIHVALHREPPPDAEIKWVYLRRSQTGRSLGWQLQFVLARDEWPRDQAETQSVGIKVGWRATPEGLHVAHAVGSDDRRRDLILPREWIEKLKHAESLRAIRDRNFNEIRCVFADWLKGKSVDLLPTPNNEESRQPDPDLPMPKGMRSGLPVWFFDKSIARADVRSLMRWRSPDRLFQLVRYWTMDNEGKSHRFPADRMIHPAMEAWRKQDRHLHEWQDHERRKVERRRDELYCRFAVDLARDYHTALIADINWASLKERPTATEDDKVIARFNAKMASPGRLCELIREKFFEMIKAPAKNIGNTCHLCGTQNKIADAIDRHECMECGAKWRIEDNYALNLLQAAAQMAI